MYKRVNVGLRYDVYTKLKDKGRFGETFSDLVSRIIDESEKNSDSIIVDKRRGRV
jgi:predicted CopG family antitoxin